MIGARAHRRQAGFTLIELMIALAISSLLLIMILAIFARMSIAYREQQAIVAVQQVLSAGRNAIERDAKQAGLMLAQGFTIAADAGTGVKRSAVRVVNSSTGPDELGFYAADPTAQALVTSTGVPTTVTVDDSTGFVAGDLVVLSTPDLLSFSNPIDPVLDARIALFRACVVQIQAVTLTTVTFQTSGAWGIADNTHCAPTAANTTMMYRFVARYWRIDPARPELGVLQLEPTGALVSAAFQDQAYGFTDLQVATYFYDGDALDTNDPDADGDRDWQSGAAQTTFTDPVLLANDFLPPLVLSVSLVARTSANVEGIATAQTPVLTDPLNPDNNMLGDRDAIPLPSTTDPALMGRRIYRHLTFQTDLRNMGVGR